MTDYSQFVLEVAAVQPSEYYAPGVILDQEPSAGERVRASQNVLHLTISGTLPTGQMPNLVNTPSAEAKQTLTDLDLELTIRTETEYSEFVEGQVIRTEPSAGETLRQQDTVTLYISLGKQSAMAEVPKLVGLQQDKALEQLKQAGLEAGLTRMTPDEAPQGEVIAQGIDAGQTVRGGTKIDLTISSGSGESQPDKTEDGDKKPDQPDEDGSDTAGPDEPEQPPAAPEPQMTTLEVQIDLPEGEGTVMVMVKVDGTTYWEYPVDRDRGTVTFTIDGVGKKQMDIYFDGVLQQTRELDFGG